MKPIRISLIACAVFATAVSIARAQATTSPPQTPVMAVDPSSKAVGPILFPNGWTINGNLDTRYRQATRGRTGQSYVNSAELDIGNRILVRGVENGNIYAQIISENVPDSSGAKGHTSDLSLGEAYVNYRLPIQTDTGSTAYLKLGQFVIPAGLLAVYDTHLHILQSLAPLGIGERIDFGVGVDGRFDGIIDYRFAVTTGEGTGHADLSADRLLTFRLGRLFATPYGVVTIGGSLLSGRLPVTRVDPATGFSPLLPPSGVVNAQYGYVDKTRIIGDAEWNYRGVIARGEAMTGADANINVQGYYLEGNYPFAPGFTGVISRTSWDYGRGGSTSADNAIGMDVAYGNNAVTRILYEERRDVPYLTDKETGPLPTTHLRHIFTVQALLRF